MSRTKNPRDSSLLSSKANATTTVLVIANNTSLVTKVRKALEPHGFLISHLESAADYGDALTSIEKHEFQLILVEGETLETLHDLICAAGMTERTLPPIVLITEEEEARPLAATPPMVIDSISVRKLSSETVTRIQRLVADHTRWRMLIDQHRSFENLITSISTRFIQLPSADIDSEIRSALAECGEFSQVDRSYLMLIAEDRQSISMTHEWCRAGIESAASFYERHPIEPIQWILNRLETGDILAFNSIRDIPEEARNLKQIALTRGLKSFVLVPLLYSGTLLGALGFSQVHEARRWQDDSVSLLRILGEILVNAVQRRRTEDAFKESEARFRTLVESLGEGIILCDTEDVILHVNSRTTDLTGYTPEEMVGQKAYDLLLPPEEQFKIRERTLRRLQGVSEAYTIRLKRRDGSRFWAEINSAPIRGANGTIVGTVGAVADISDRKLALEALQASERKYRDLVETSSDLIWSCDLEGRWTFVNRVAERINGYKPAEMLGRPFQEFVAPHLLDKDIAAFKRLFDGESIIQYETEHIRKDGTVVPLSFNAIILRDKDGRPIGATGTASDLTQRKRAEAALSKSEERFRRYFDLPLIGMSVSSSERRWFDVNQKFCEMLGYDRDEIIGRSWMDFTHPEDLERNKAVIDSSSRGEVDQWSYDKRFIRKDGSVLYVTTSGACVRRADGNVDYFLALHQDITARKMAETEMLRQKQFLRDVIDCSPNVIFAKDPEGRYTLANLAMADLYGLGLDEIVGMTDLDLTDDPQEAKNFLEADQEVLHSNQQRFFPDGVYIDRRTGERRCFHTIKRPLRGPSGETEGVLGVAWDMTDLKIAEETSSRLQKQLLQSQKMEAIGQLAAGIAHDLNNALAAVVGHLQLLRMGGEDAHKDEHSIDTALSGCKRASTLIEQLLGFSRQGKYNISTISLQRLLRETIDFLKKVVGTDVRMTFESSGPELTVRGDPAQIQQAFTNLIINAKQSMPSGGSIAFRIGQKMVDHPDRFNQSARPGRYHFVSVEDSGSGIAPENLDKIFEPFFTTKSQAQGTGLGLSTVYGVMQSHGGWVDVESTLGRGSVFSLYFPESKGAVLEVVHSKPKETKSCSGTVVVIDDEKVLVDLGQEFLRRSGFKSFGFTDAQSFLDWYRSHSKDVDMLILDMKMPGMDGAQCFGEIRKINPKAQVVILSGYSEDAQAQELLKSGALKFFQKPLKYPELIGWIAQTLAKSDAA